LSERRRGRVWKEYCAASGTRRILPLNSAGGRAYGRGVVRELCPLTVLVFVACRTCRRRAHSASPIIPAEATGACAEPQDIRVCCPVTSGAAAQSGAGDKPR